MDGPDVELASWKPPFCGGVGFSCGRLLGVLSRVARRFLAVLPAAQIGCAKTPSPLADQAVNPACWSPS